MFESLWDVKTFLTHGMEVIKLRTVNSFTQSMWLEKYISFDTQKRKKVKMIARKVSIVY